MRDTQTVRNIAKKYGADSDSIWTNKYAKCRTVKIYANWIKDKIGFMEAVSAALPDATFKSTGGEFAGGAALIVRLAITY